jgi:hypothetical protein
MELDYLHFLQESFKSDPWFTYRFRKYMAGPKRIGWKNYRELKIRKRRDFYYYALIGAVAFYPVACVFGRRM